MTKFSYDFNDDNKLYTQVSIMTEENVKSELVEVMKIWQAICDKLLPDVIGVKTHLTPILISDVQRRNRSVWRTMLIIDGSCIDNSDNIAYFRSNTNMSRITADPGYVFDEFNSKEKAELFKALYHLKFVFSGSSISQDVYMPENGKEDKDMIFGCYISRTLKSCMKVNIKFPKCNSLEDIVITLLALGLDLGVV